MTSIEQTRNTDLPPADAAVLIIVDTETSPPKLLMGRRNKDLVFMPDTLVFPGGRVDPQDEDLNTPDKIPETLENLILQKKLDHSPLNNAKTLPLTAIRETYEETGILIGNTQQHSIQTNDKTWSDFLQQGVTPTPSLLRYCARAITPPNRVRRYDTRFFCVEAKHIAKRTPFTPGELEEIHWLTFEEAFHTDLATITRTIMQDVQNYIIDGSIFKNSVPIPFYFSQEGQFKRDIIS